jgi:tetratricopeptide (TPR) repeat protein
MQQRGRIEEKVRKQIQLSCCEYVLDNACRFDDPTFAEKSKALAAEDTNIQSILFGSSHTIPSDRTIEALIAFSWHRTDTMPDLEIPNHAVKAAKSSGVKCYITSAVWCLGCTYRQLGDRRSSYNHLQEAYLFSSNSSADDMELQRLHCQCGNDLVEVAKLTSEDKAEAVSLARDVEIQCSALSDDNIHGLSLVHLGSALSKARQQQEALVHLNRALIMLKAAKNIPNLATAYQVIAHYREWRLPEALDAIQEAWKLVESGSDANAKALISGKIHFSTNRDTDPWKLTEIALMQASQHGDRLTTAWILSLMGHGPQRGLRQCIWCL